MASKMILPARQERSRQTLTRLLEATIEALNQDGLDKATIPRIAERAGVTVGTVYQRFPDKDSLLQVAFLEMLERNVAAAKQAFRPEKWRERNLAEIICAVVEGTLNGHRRHREFLRALLRYTLEYQDSPFVRQSDELQQRALLAISDLILTRRKEIRHPDPDTAVPMMLLMIGMVAKGTLGLRQTRRTPSPLLHNAESNLQQELPEIVLSYLGVKPNHGKPKA